jgi:N-acetylneuraminic acid mutarotase
MKFIPPFLLLSFLFTLSLWSASPVPYSGKIDIRGVNYFGEAQFAFSLHDGNGTTHWRNGKQPGETIKVTIRNGRYSVLLGGQGMNSLPPELFLKHDKLYLKVEFDNEDGEGLRHLAPDQLITATPRALVADIAKLAKVAQVAEKVGNGAITRDMLSSEVLAQLDANATASPSTPITITRDMLPASVLNDLNKPVTITRDMLPQDVRDDLNKTVTITRNMLSADVLADLNKSSTTASPITLSMLAPEVTAKLDQNGSGGSGIAVGGIISFPSGQTAPAGYSLYQRGTPKELVWEEKAPVSVARWAYDGVEILDGKIYFIGGFDSSAKNITERYDPATNTWETLNSMSVARRSVASTVLNGKLYAIGGYGLSSVEVFDPSTGNWTAGVPLPSEVSTGTAITVNEKIYLVGGRNASNQTINQVLAFDASTNQWTTKANMLTERHGMQLVWFENRIWAIGGNGGVGGYSNKVESYDPSSNSWNTNTSMIVSRFLPSAWVGNGNIYVYGGYNGAFPNSIEIYNPITEVWSLHGNLPESKEGGDAVVLNDQVFVVAGKRNSSGFSNKVFAADLNASVAGVYDLYRKDGNASAGTPVVQAEVADGSVTASKIANKTIGKDQISDEILKYLKPEITAQPQAQAVYADSNVAFSVTAEGKYLTYQWKKDGSNLTGETNSTLNITDANATQHDGNYSVVVSNDFGSEESEYIEVNVSNALLDELVGWWKFDETSGTVAYDSSGNGNDGNLTNGPTWVSGKIGGALSFDGVDDFVHVNNFEWGGEITVATFVKYLTLRKARIIDFGNGQDADNVHLGSSQSSVNTLQFHIRRSGSSYQGPAQANFLYAGDWLHIVATINDQNQATVYRNGEIIVRSSAWTPSTVLRTKQYIAKSNWNEEYLNALIDDLRIYDRALSAAEVQALHNLGQ